jgi:hypothetical protein
LKLEASIIMDEGFDYELIFALWGKPGEKLDDDWIEEIQDLIDAEKNWSVGMSGIAARPVAEQDVLTSTASEISTLPTTMSPVTALMRHLRKPKTLCSFTLRRTPQREFGSIRVLMRT